MDSLKREFSLTLLIVIMAIANSPLFAAEFFRKQTGTTTIAAGSATRTVIITGVDMSQSFLVFSTTIDDQSPANFQVGGEITNSTTLSFERTGTAGTVSISYQVFEFQGGIFVQHGSSTNITRGAAVDVPISCVDLTKSFVLVSARKSGAQLGADDGITADLTSSTNLQLQISNAGPGGADMEEAYWQIIEYQAATIKKVTTTLAAGTATATSTITPSITTLSKAFVISNHRQNGDVNPDDLPRTELTNVSTVTYTRVGTTADISFVTYIIEFTDQSAVIRGTQSFASTVTSANVGITAANSSGVIGPGNYGRQGSTDFAVNDNPGHSWFTYQITSAINLLISRATGTAGGNSSANAPYQIVTFEDLNVQQNTFYSRASGAWEANTSWSFTPDGSSGAVPTGVYPRRRNNVVIQTGHNITINSVTDNGPCSTSPDGLLRSNVGPFAASNLVMFYQTGDILIRGTLTVTGIEMMTEGYTKIVSGGAFNLSSSYVNLGFLEADAGSTLSAADDIILAGNSNTIINTTSISNDDLIISFTNATLCGTGSTTLVNGSGSSLTYANGATVAQICTTFTVACSGLGCSGFPVIGTGPSLLGINGPGGVAGTDGTTSLVLWLDANRVTGTNGATITSWNDLSGRGNNFTMGNGAIFNTNIVNSIYPAFNFNGTSHYFETSAFNASLTPANYTIFSTNRVTSSGAVKAVISNRDIVGGNTRGFILNAIATSNNWEFWTGNGTASFDITTNNTNTAAAWASQSMEYQVAANGKKLYINNSLASQNTHTMTTNAVRPVRVGAGQNETTPAFFFNGLIGEVIMYNSVLNTARQIIVNNYLSAKYNYTIAANNVYTFDDAALTFDHEVAGIGQASDGSSHKDARGPGVVRMWNPSLLANNDFLMWGHDNTALNSVNITIGLSGVDGTVIQERLSRIWRVGEQNDVGTVSVSFDLSTIGFPLGSNLRLLIDRDGDGFGDNDVIPMVGSFINNTVVFSGVDFTNGDRFTLGNTDKTISLPIELISFNARPQNQTVLVNWSTASELNNDFFTIERTKDAKDWVNIGTVKGMGNSTVKLDYQYADENPYEGVSYYRLKQTDFDKKFAYSKVVRVELKEGNQILVYPNPSSRTFTLTSGTEIKQIKFLSTLGNILPISIEKKITETVIDPGDISPGIYFIQVLTVEGIKSIRVVKK